MVFNSFSYIECYVKHFSKYKTLNRDLDQKSISKIYRKTDLNLQPVKSSYYVGPKTYWTNIVVLGLLVTKIYPSPVQTHPDIYTEMILENVFIKRTNGSVENLPQDQVIGKTIKNEQTEHSKGVKLNFSVALINENGLGAI